MVKVTKAELAARLGVLEDDLLSRAAAAEMLGLGKNTLRTHPNVYVGFYRLADSKTSPALYPKPWVEDYKRWRDGSRTSRFPDEKCGPQTTLPPQRSISVAAAVLMIERWKYRELHQRCEVACGREVPWIKVMERHRNEAALLYDHEGNQRPLDDPNLLAALVSKAREIVQPAGSCDHPDRLVRLMQIVWTHVLSTEREWLVEGW